MSMTDNENKPVPDQETPESESSWDATEVRDESTGSSQNGSEPENNLTSPAIGADETVASSVSADEASAADSGAAGGEVEQSASPGDVKRAKGDSAGSISGSGETGQAADDSSPADVTEEPAETEPAETEPATAEPSKQEEPSAGGEPEPVYEKSLDELEREFDDDFADDDEDEDAEPIESLVEEGAGGDELDLRWYILKVQVNRETSICDALRRRVSVAGLDSHFSDILVPTEDVREFTKSGKQRIVKRKLYPGYIVVRMAITDESWFLVRETPGIGDFTGAAGQPVALTEDEISRILQTTRPSDEEQTEESVKTAIKYNVGDRVRVKEGNFQNYEGEVSNIDERNGRVTVMINIFNRPNPVELDHWQVEEFD